MVRIASVLSHIQMLLQDRQLFLRKCSQFLVLETLRGSLKLFDVFLVVHHRVMQKRFVELSAIQFGQRVQSFLVFGIDLGGNRAALPGDYLLKLLVRRRMVADKFLTQIFYL